MPYKFALTYLLSVYVRNSLWLLCKRTSLEFDLGCAIVCDIFKLPN